VLLADGEEDADGAGGDHRDAVEVDQQLRVRRIGEADGQLVQLAHGHAVDLLTRETHAREASLVMDEQTGWLGDAFHSWTPHGRSGQLTASRRTTPLTIFPMTDRPRPLPHPLRVVVT